MSRPIVFLTDYGLADEFVGVCHGVIARIAPDAHVIDLSHAVPRQDVLRGAITLGRSVPYLPDDAVYLGVVDPGVGSERRAIVVRTVSGVDLVGPDNGLLSFAWDALGGVDAVVEVRSDAVVLAPVSRTFHGRDVFAPAAAHVARGMALTDLGPVVDPGSLRTLEVPGPMVAVGAVGARVMSVDGFGNVQLNARADDLEAAGIGDTMSVGGRVVPRVGIFSDVPPGAVAALLDSQGQLALVVNSGSAAETLGLVVGRAVVIEAVETTAILGPEAPEPGGLDPTA
jgi:S-adenosylmethionine hydrolase